MRVKRLSVGIFEANCYVVISKKGRAIIIDPGAEGEIIKGFLRENKIVPSFILHTHGHFDHIGADKEFDLPIYIHREDVVLLNDPILNLSELFAKPYTLEEARIIPFESEEDITLDEVRLKVIHTPGHTPGSSCFLSVGDSQRLLFSGDTLFSKGIGRTDFPGSCQERLIDSVKQKLLILDDNTRVYPGHGPFTYIRIERRSNPFLK